MTITGGILICSLPPLPTALKLPLDFAAALQEGQIEKWSLTFVWLTAVVFAKGFVFGDIWVQVLEGVFRNVVCHDNFVVAQYVGKRQGR